MPVIDVEKFLGTTLRLDTDKAKFIAFTHGARYENKTLDGLKADVASSVRVPEGRKVRVLKAYYTSSEVWPPTVGNLQQFNITGLKMVKERGESPRLVFSTEENGQLSMHSAFSAADDILLAKIDTLRKRWVSANSTFAAEARDLFNQFQSVSAEAIIESLLTGNPVAVVPQAEAESNTEAPAV